MPKCVPVIFNTLQHAELGDRVGDGCVTASLLKELVYPGWASSKAITPNTTFVREQQPIRMSDMHVLAISKTGHPSRENFSLFAHVCSTPMALTHGHIRPCCHRVWHTSVGFSYSLFFPALMTWRPLHCCNFCQFVQLSFGFSCLAFVSPVL